MQSDEPLNSPIVCSCSGTRREQILKRFEEGLRTLDALSQATGACSGCGACEPEVEALIQTLVFVAGKDPCRHSQETNTGEMQ